VCSSLGSERQKKTLAGLKNLKRSIAYVAGTVNMGLIYHGVTTSRFAQITVYVDSEFGGDLKLTINPTRRPRYGFGIFAGNDLVAYRTKPADAVVLSSANAEIIGLSEACRNLPWTRNLLEDLRFKLNPTVVYEDNAAAISIATRAYLTSRTRHILHLRDLYVRELVTKGDVEIRVRQDQREHRGFLHQVPAGCHVPHPPRYPHGHLPGQARVNFDFTPLVRGDIYVYVATTSSSNPPPGPGRSEWEC